MLLRKIASKKRWDINDVPKQIPRKKALFSGDAISDLRTRGNTISVWHTPDLEKENIKDILAVMALNCDKIDRVVYVALEEEELERRGISTKPVMGDCPAITDQNILNRHRDIVEVDFWHLGLLAEYIYDLIKAGHVYSAKVTDIKSYIADIIALNKLDITKLNDSKCVSLGYKPTSPCYACQKAVSQK